MINKKVAMFTDIHFGRQNNSEVHNIDCINFIQWFCTEIKKDASIEAIMFLGDWHEHRAAINGMTLHYSQMGASMLSSLGLPIYFIVGNHDLYFRNTRDIFTTVIFNKLDNFTLVDKPTILPKYGCVLAPFLFESEYSNFFAEYSNYEIFFGHFEFKGFVLTGETVIKETGPDPVEYSTPKRIFSGHYHRRQCKNNIHYIGSAFPADFSDANDTKRGFATYQFETDELMFYDWPECPKYIKTTLSEILAKPKQIIANNARLKVAVDKTITLTESNAIRKAFMEKYKLREIILEEQAVNLTELTDVEIEINQLKLESITQIIPELIKRVKDDRINADKLVRIYNDL